MNKTVSADDEILVYTDYMHALGEGIELWEAMMKVAEGIIGSSPLHRAIINGHDDTAIFLINHGADTEALNDKRDSPFDLARRLGREQIISAFTPSKLAKLKELRELVDEFVSLPNERKGGGRFIVDENIWTINIDLAIPTLRELIALFRAFPKVIDWSAKYSSKGTFIFGTPISNDNPKDEGTIAAATINCIYLGTKYYSSSLETFREDAKRMQTEKDEDGTTWHVPTIVHELQTIRHEFGHVLQDLFQKTLVSRNPKYSKDLFFCGALKDHFIKIAKLRKWDVDVPRMSRYGATKDKPWEWFAESFANSRNAMDIDPALPEQVRRINEMIINEARIVGEFVEKHATDIGSDINHSF